MSDEWPKALISGLELLENPSEALIDRAWQVATATGADLSRAQLHDICQALADEIRVALACIRSKT